MEKYAEAAELHVAVGPRAEDLRQELVPRGPRDAGQARAERPSNLIILTNFDEFSNLIILINFDEFS